MFVVSSCSCLCPIHWNQVLSWEWRCSWSSTGRRCSIYPEWSTFFAYKDATYIRSLMVVSVFMSLVSVPVCLPTCLAVSIHRYIICLCFSGAQKYVETKTGKLWTFPQNDKSAMFIKGTITRHYGVQLCIHSTLCMMNIQHEWNCIFANVKPCMNSLIYKPTLFSIILQLIHHVGFMHPNKFPVPHLPRSSTGPLQKAR